MASLKKIKIKRRKKSAAIKLKRYIRLCIPDFSIQKPSKDSCIKCADVRNYKSKVMEYDSINRSSGLSPKEKSYVICRCQTKTIRFKYLKNKGTQAIRENKIFAIGGCCSPIRQALLERGWVEKLPPAKMNLSKIRKGNSGKPEVERLFLSHFIDKHPPNFIWYAKDEFRFNTVDMSNLEFPTIVNRLNTDPLWTTKQGLCASMKRNYWFYIEDVAEVVGPRSYNTGGHGELDGFINDYQITACSSLLKWVLSMVANERPVFVETGKISLNVVLFALCRCKEYLYRKENKDIDRIISNVSPGQWNSFLKKYYRIIGKDDVFEKDTENKLPLYAAYAKFLLKQMHRYRPQLSCEGCHNIWIIKPAHNSRGRGIRLASRLPVITDLLNKASDKYVIQKYVEEPILIHETKFDIRQYCLITSTYPLVVWMYRDCYLKFSSQKYNLRNYHESIHLTNNAVQKNYKNCPGRHKDLPPSNMWHSDRYKDYLNRIDKSQAWEKIIYPGMKKCIIGIMLSCQDSLPVTKNRFELYGCDFLLDKEYKPWLIEINSNPDLNHTTAVTAKICPAVLSDIIKVVVDYARDSSASTGQFECIYRQPMTVPKYGVASDMYVRGINLPSNYFYKGSIDLRETYDNDEDILRGNNIKDMLDKIKQAFDPESIMVEPEDDERNEVMDAHSRTDFDVKTKASVMTDELVNRLDSLCNLDLESRLESGTESPVDICLTPTQSLHGVKTMLHKSAYKYNITTEAIEEKESFDFSDDGPIRKKSVVAVDSRKRKIYKNIKDLFKELKISDGPSRKDGYSSSTETMLTATSKLIDFINKMEGEYCSEELTDCD